MFFYMLIGSPYSGKSTWSKLKVISLTKKCTVLSTDDIIEKYATKVNMTYSDVFQSYYKTAEKEMYDSLETAIVNNENIIWDQTNLQIKGRAKKLRMVPNNKYYKIAVVFNSPSEEELSYRIEKRQDKIIPRYIIENMKNIYEPPSLLEGFDEIIQGN